MTVDTVKEIIRIAVNNFIPDQDHWEVDVEEMYSVVYKDDLILVGSESNQRFKITVEEIK